MIILGGLLLFVACVIHCWWAGNNAALPWDRAPAFADHAKGIIYWQIVVLISGLIIIWIAKGFIAVAAAAAIYFFLLPLITMPLLKGLHMIPDPDPDPQGTREFNEMMKEMRERESEIEKRYGS